MKPCRLCGGTLEMVIPMRPMPEVERYVATPTAQELHPCDVYLCEDCGHTQLIDVIPPSQLYGNYLFRTGDNPALVEHYRQYAEDCKRFDPTFVVEIGSNDGTLLKMFEQQGCDVLGVDPSDVARDSEVMKEPAFFTEEVASYLADEYGRADLILANHVFAHVDDLLDFMRGVNRLLSPNGTFIFEAAYLWDMLDQNYYDTIYHEHLSYHSIAPLIKAFAKVSEPHNSLFINEVQHNHCKGGSIRGIVNRSQVQQLYFPERIVTKHAFTSIHTAILRGQRKMRDIGDCVGYGASASATVTAYQLGIQHRLKFLVDDNGRKHGLFSPGANIPVLHPEMLNNNALPIVILPTRYTDEIIARHPEHAHRFVDVR